MEQIIDPNWPSHVQAAVAAAIKGESEDRQGNYAEAIYLYKQVIDHFLQALQDVTDNAVKDHVLHGNKKIQDRIDYLERNPPHKRLPMLDY